MLDSPRQSHSITLSIHVPSAAETPVTIRFSPRSRYRILVRRERVDQVSDSWQNANAHIEELLGLVELLAEGRFIGHHSVGLGNSSKASLELIRADSQGDIGVVLDRGPT